MVLVCTLQYRSILIMMNLNPNIVFRRAKAASPSYMEAAGIPPSPSFGYVAKLRRVLDIWKSETCAGEVYLYIYYSGEGPIGSRINHHASQLASPVALTQTRSTHSHPSSPPPPPPPLPVSTIPLSLGSVEEAYGGGHMSGRWFSVSQDGNISLILIALTIESPDRLLPNIPLLRLRRWIQQVRKHGKKLPVSLLSFPLYL